MGLDKFMIVCKVFLATFNSDFTIVVALLFFVIIEEPSMAEPFGLFMGTQTSGC